MTPGSATPTAARWFYIRDRKRTGPVALEELRRLVAAEQLLPTDMVLAEGGQKWCAAKEVPGLFAPTAGLATTVDAGTQEEQPPDEDGASQKSTVGWQSPPSDTREPLPAVPGYELLGILGRGGMGVVYKARQVKANRLVALKMILAGPRAAGQQLERFRTEAKAVARLQHPRIVQVFEVGDHDGAPFFSLEFVDGGTLAHKLHRQPLAPSEAALLSEALAQAMQAAHQAGIVHRDLKPANVLLTQGGEPKITDFGLAKRLDEDSGLTTEGAIMGTPSYMAPEQAAGHVQEVGPAADVYALGAILYECLTGRPPFLGATLLETLEQVQTREPIAPTHLQPKTPRDLETICLKCLQKEPSRRYATAAELAGELRRFLNGEPIHARPVGGLERAVKWARRRPAVAGLLTAVAALAVLVFVVGLVGLVGILWNWQEARAASARAEQKATAETAARKDEERQRRRAEDAEKSTRKKNEELLRQAYVTNVTSAAKALDENDTTRAEAFLRDCPTELRRWEWHYLSRRCRAMLFGVNGMNDVTYTPDGKQFLTMGGGVVHTFETNTGREMSTLPLNQYRLEQHLRMNRNGERLAYMERKEMFFQAIVRERVSGKIVRLMRGFRGELTNLDLNPDGDKLATCGGLAKEGELKVWDVGTGQALLDVKGIKTLLRVVCFSPNGKRLATGGADGSVRLWDTATGQEVRTFAGHEAGVNALAFTPDGASLISGGDDRLLKRWDAIGDHPPALFRGHQGVIQALAVSPDGERVVSGGLDRAVKMWTLTGRELETYQGHSLPVTSVAFSPDGAHIASADWEGTKIWDAITPPGSAFLPLPYVYVLAMSPDGSRVVTNHLEHQIQVWDRATGRLLMTPGGPQLSVTALAYRPNGKEIASGGEDGHIRLWDATNGQPIREFTVQGTVLVLTYNADGTRLAVRSAVNRVKESTVQVFDTATGQPLYSQAGPAALNLTGLAFSPDGTRLAIAGERQHPKRVVVVETSSGKTLRTFGGHSQSVIDLTWQGDRIASASEDGTVAIWDAATGEVSLTLSISRASVAWVRIAFSPEGDRLAILMDNRLSLRELTDGKEVFAVTIGDTTLPVLAFSQDGRYLAINRSDGFSISLLDGGPGPVALSLRGKHETGSSLAVAFSPDGHLLAGGEKRISVWDTTTGEELAPFPVVRNNVGVVAFSPDNRLLAAGTFKPGQPPEPGEIKIWDVESRKEVLAFREHTDLIRDLVFSPDGQRIASASQDRSVKVWDVQTGHVELNLTEHEDFPMAVVFSHDGTKIASSCADKKIRVWDAVTGRRLFVYKSPDPTRALGQIVFSRDDKYLVTCGVNLTVLDAATGQPVRVLSPGEGDCSALAMTQDGQRLAAQTPSGVVVWDFATGQELARFATPGTFAASLAFSPDGTRLAVGSRISLDVFDVSEAGLAQQAAQRRDAAQRVLAWHSSRGMVALQNGNWANAHSHYSSLILLEPTNARNYAFRADANVELAHWDAAQADAAQAIALAPEVPLIWYRQALLQLRAGKTMEYRKTCEAVLQRFGETKDADIANDVAWICCLAPDAVSDRKTLVNLAERGLAQKATAANLGTLGAALYRAGRPEEAVTRLREAIQLHKNGGSAADWFLLALAYQALNQKDKAKESLNFALAQQKKSPPGQAWSVRLQIELLRAETEELLKEKKP